MTLNEFKAWFEGFTEDMDGAPSVKQFEKIKAKVAEIDDKPITQTVFVDRYRDLWPRQWWENDRMWKPYVTCAAEGKGGPGSVMSMSNMGVVAELRETWDSVTAMREVGRAEAAA